MILRQYLRRALKLIHKKRVHFVVIGDCSVFDAKTRGIIEQLDRDSSCYGRVLNIALNYGGRAELVRAANRAFAEKIEVGRNDFKITEEDIEKNLYTAGHVLRRT